MPQSRKFESGKLLSALEALDKTAPKPKETINLRELIKGLKPKIKRLRSWNYSWAEIVELLKQQQIEISENTLKEYVKTPRRQKDKLATKETVEPSQPKNNRRVRSEDDKVEQEKATGLNESKEKPQQVAVALLEEQKELPKSIKPESEPSDYKPMKLTMRK